jgi:hypothetical protein
MTGSSIRNVSSTSTSIDWGSALCNIASWWSISIPTASRLGTCRFFEVLTSTGMCLVPREPFQGTHSITLALDLLWKTLDAFMPLGAMGSSYVAVHVFQRRIRKQSPRSPCQQLWQTGYCFSRFGRLQMLTLLPAALIHRDWQAIKPLWGVSPVQFPVETWTFPSHLFPVR